MNILVSLDFWSYVAVFAGIYVFLGMGLQIQLGYAGVVNFGVVGFMALSAYTFAIVTVRAHAPFALAVIAALTACTVFAFLMGPVVVRLRADYLAIATIAMAETIRYTALNWTSLTGGALGSIGIGGTDSINSYSDGWNKMLQPLIDRLRPALGTSARNVAMLSVEWGLIALLSALLTYWLHSPWGRVLQALRDDDRATSALGKRVQTYRLQALVLGAVLAGLGGIFFALTFSTFSPADFQADVTTFTYMVLIIGGLGTIRSVPVGAAIFAFIYAGSRFFDFAPFSLLADDDRAFLRMILIGLLLILIIWIRPQGLFGKKNSVVLK